MSTTTDTTETTTDTTPAQVTSLHALADFFAANPDLIADFASVNYRLLIPVSYSEDPRERMAAFIRAGKTAGLTIRKSYDDVHGSVDVDFGAFSLHVYAQREKVCERVVTGTREVTREVPDPEALKAVPTVTLTETVEDVEWVCTPLLADPPAHALPLTVGAETPGAVRA